MARPREFDEVTALEAAIECFWQRGYEATSVRDLANKMGLSAPSLYNTYGDKHALFVQALEHYLDHSTRARIERLEKSLPPKQAIRRFIEETGYETEAKKSGNGGGGITKRNVISITRRKDIAGVTLVLSRPTISRW